MAIRKAGEAVDQKTDRYGAWKNQWDSSAVNQQVKGNASAYSADSDISKQFNSLSKNKNTNVDDDGEWRTLVYSQDDKNAGSYADQVAKWQAAGYDVRAQDMSDKFRDGNIAVRRSGGKGSYGEQNTIQTEGKPLSSQSGGNGGAGGNAVSSQEFKDMYTTDIADSYNAQGGTLTNSGDLTAGRDISLDNSVTNQNTHNTFGGDVRNFTYNAPGGGGSAGSGGGGGGGASYPSMNSYKDPALNATPVSAATMAGFYQPSDSPAAAAKFNALHSEINRGKQEKYTNVGSDVAKKYIDAASKSKTINTKALNANLAAQPMVNFAQSDMITAQTFGDIWKFKPKDFYMPDPFTKPEQPDFEDMYSNIADDIKG